MWFPGGHLSGPRASQRARVAILTIPALVLVLSGAESRAGKIRFVEAQLIIEFNDTDQDVGVQIFLDAEGWQSVQIHDPSGVLVFRSETSGSMLEQGGGTELFAESEEPPLSELPLEEFFRLFPEGRYRFSGLTADGDTLMGSSTFSHEIPAGPQIVLPPPAAGGCSENVPIPATIAWNPVTTSIEGAPIEIVAYELIVEGGVDLDVTVSADTLSVTLPPEILEEGTAYDFEVLAIADSGNQTITQGCFVTAP